MTLGQEIADLRAKIDGLNERAKVVETEELNSITAFAESAYKQAPKLDVLRGATVEFVYADGRWAWKRTVAGKRFSK